MDKLEAPGTRIVVVFGGQTGTVTAVTTTGVAEEALVLLAVKTLPLTLVGTGAEPELFETYMEPRHARALAKTLRQYADEADRMNGGPRVGGAHLYDVLSRSRRGDDPAGPPDEPHST
jgi:hypothetical protein